MSDVHFATIRRVKLGYEETFVAKLHEFIRESMNFRGVVGVHVIQPPADTDSREFGILRSFDGEESAAEFYSSDVFAAWSRAISPLVEGEPIQRRLSGLEAFFRGDGGNLPPRWKMAVITFLGVFPAVLLWSSVLSPLLSGLHFLIKSVVVNAAVVATLTWIVMPLLTRFFHRWLHADAN